MNKKLAHVGYMNIMVMPGSLSELARAVEWHGQSVDSSSILHGSGFMGLGLKKNSLVGVAKVRGFIQDPDEVYFCLVKNSRALHSNMSSFKLTPSVPTIPKKTSVKMVHV